ncbi:MAG: hypothetical protein PHI41_05790 [Erysipelotrichaceae bacterium]|nr:hypothetical protein [Erysipelotrichaceae bacterium]MDD3809782.1 hypothetical protein [Erysipelotrichaceae bacterium]
MKENSSSARKTARYFLVAKVLFGITPFVAYLYLTLQGSLMASSLQGMLESYPGLVVIFILAMVNPYISYLLSLIEKNLAAGNHKFALINMGIILITQLASLNFFYLSLLVYVFYRAIKDYKLDLKSQLFRIPIVKVLHDGGGSLIVLAVNLLCLFTTIKII